MTFVNEHIAVPRKLSVSIVYLQRSISCKPPTDKQLVVIVGRAYSKHYVPWIAFNGPPTNCLIFPKDNLPKKMSDILSCYSKPEAFHLLSSQVSFSRLEEEKKAANLYRITNHRTQPDGTRWHPRTISTGQFSCHYLV